MAQSLPGTSAWPLGLPVADGVRLPGRGASEDSIRCGGLAPSDVGGPGGTADRSPDGSQEGEDVFRRPPVLG